MKISWGERARLYCAVGVGGSGVAAVISAGAVAIAESGAMVGTTATSSPVLQLIRRRSSNAKN